MKDKKLAVDVRGCSQLVKRLVMNKLWDSPVHYIADMSTFLTNLGGYSVTDGDYYRDNGYTIKSAKEYLRSINPYRGKEMNIMNVPMEAEGDVADLLEMLGVYGKRGCVCTDYHYATGSRDEYMVHFTISKKRPWGGTPDSYHPSISYEQFINFVSIKDAYWANAKDALKFWPDGSEMTKFEKDWYDAAEMPDYYTPIMYPQPTIGEKLDAFINEESDLIVREKSGYCTFHRFYHEKDLHKYNLLSEEEFFDTDYVKEDIEEVLKQFDWWRQLSMMAQAYPDTKLVEEKEEKPKHYIGDTPVIDKGHYLEIGDTTISKSSLRTASRVLDELERNTSIPFSHLKHLISKYL